MSEDTGAGANLRLVFRNRNVRRVQLAYFGSETAVWVYTVALVVWTYEEGGAALVGAYAGIRMLFSAVGIPVGGVIADRMSRRNYLIGCNLLRLPLVAAAAVGIHFDLGVWAVLVPGVLLTMLAETFRPAQAGLLPTLVDEPKELTAANATAETIQGTTGFIGPALGGLLIALVGTAPVVLVSALGSFWGIALLMRVPRDRAAAPTQGSAQEPVATSQAGAPVENEPGESLLQEVLGGFTAVRADRHLSVLTGIYLVGGMLVGVYLVVLVLVAGEWLGNPAAVGWMNGLAGAASIVGGIAVLSLAHRLPLARLTHLASLGLCLALVVLGAAPRLAVVVLAMIAIGLLQPATFTGLGTIPQRLVPARMIARVIAAMNAAGVAAAAMGAFLTPVLIHYIGLRWTLVVTGGVGAGAMLVLGIWIPALDSRLRNPRGLELLRDIYLFAPLSPILLDQLAHRLEPVTVPEGAAIVSEGEVADRFYVIESGAVQVLQGGRLLRTEGPGEVFGEIGLLRGVPRTATVLAATGTTVLALPRQDFLEVLAGDEHVRGLADDLVRRRLAG